ncbi:MAG TPA: hypothetical protein VK790_14910 [Solirubrobacteraceae bacterium]|jgi:hypothetical protein|nr:hypothetical protein [Solirubrobacteraceae bacterium]
MASASRRISLGFDGGQVLALRVSDEQLQKLNKVLGEGGWHDIEGEDGPVRVDLDKVVYVNADKDESKVGFG